MQKNSLATKPVYSGNVDTVTSLLQGTTEKVRADSEACIQAAAADGAYMLGSGCMVPRDTPLENLLAMIDVARSHKNDWMN